MQLGVELGGDQAKINQMAETSGEDYVGEVLKAYGHQVHVVDEYQACPRCYAGIEVN